MQVMAYRLNGDTSNIERVFLYKDSGATAGTEGDPITGLTNSSTGLNISTIAHNEAAPNTDTSAATSSIEAVGTLGTYSAPTSGFVRFSEVDATDMPGLYELQWEDARYVISSAIWLDIAISGVADLAPFHGRIYLEPVPANVQEWIGTAVTLGSGAPDVNIQTSDNIDFGATQKASINTEVVDVIRTDTVAELSAVPSATSSLMDKLNWVFMLSRNKITQTATTKTLRNDADDGNVATASVSSDGTTATRGEYS